MNPRLPPPALAVLQALQPDADHGRAAVNLDSQGWLEAARFADRTQLTLHWRCALHERGLWPVLPGSLRSRLDQNLADNAGRLRVFRESYGAIASRLESRGIDFVLLKGLSHSPDFVEDPRLRVQNDIDLFCPSDTVRQARDVLLQMGYEPLAGMEGYPTDHLPSMVKKTGFRWRDNDFDPAMPLPVDLHFRFWDEQTERIRAPGVDCFWDRREGCRLEIADRLGYAALHALRHVLRGGLGLANVYEIARFLERRASDGDFWRRWRDLHSPELRCLQTIVFRLARIYFDCPEAGDSLPESVERWLREYGWSPLESLIHPNKHELYLNLALLPRGAGKAAVVRRRLFPLGLPPMDTVVEPETGITAGRRVERAVQYARYVMSRVGRHSRVLLPTLWGLARWRWRSRA